MAEDAQKDAYVTNLCPHGFSRRGVCLACESIRDAARGMPLPPRPVHHMELDPKNDAVNHPSHYTKHPSGVECITVTEHMNFNVGNAIKYLWRAGSKNNLLEDLKKARWYVDREILRQSTAQK